MFIVEFYCGIFVLCGVEIVDMRVGCVYSCVGDSLCDKLLFVLGSGCVD